MQPMLTSTHENLKVYCCEFCQNGIIGMLQRRGMHYVACAGADVRRVALLWAEAGFQEAALLDDTPQRSAGLRAVHALLPKALSSNGI